MRQTEGPSWDDEEEEEASDPRWTGEGQPSVDTVVCPHCRRDVYEEAEQCPYCGDFITEGPPHSRMAWWVIGGLVAAMLMALVWAIFPSRG